MFPIIRDFLPSDIGPAVRLLEECRGLPDTKSVDIAQFVNDVSSGAPGVVAIESERILHHISHGTRLHFPARHVFFFG